jgi:hypothetical protein
VSTSPTRIREIERTDRIVIFFRILVAFAVICTAGFSIAAETQILDNQHTSLQTLAQVTAVVKVVCDSESASLRVSAPPEVTHDLHQLCALIRVPVP